jgi:polyisoprenoid-binding protein YceI
MKKILLTLIALPILAFNTFATHPPHTDNYTVNTSESKVQWFASKITSDKKEGVVSVKSGTLSSSHGKLSGTVVMDMTSIAVVGMDGEYKSKLENHLRSDDFFGVEEFPTATIVINSVAPISNAAKDGNNFNVNGKMTIKGITNDVMFPASIRFNENGMSVKGEVTIDRSKYNVKYGSNSFFDDLGDKAIKNEFKLIFSLTANK